MIRWVFVCNSTGGAWGGIENWMVKLARGLRGAGDVCAVIAPSESHWPSVCRRQELLWEPFAFEPEWNPAATLRLRGALRRLQPDAAICASFRDARRIRAADRRPAIGVKLPVARALTNGYLDRFSFRYAVDRLFADHRAARRLLLRHPWVQAGKILLAPNGVECDIGGPDPARRAAARSALGAGPETVIVAAAARFTAEKRMMEIVEGFARAANISALRLFLMGDGPQRAELEREIQRRGLGDRVALLGWRDDAAELLRGCDVVVHAGLSDAMPNSVLEGMAAGAVVLAARAGGAAELITSGRDGFLFEPGDVDALAARLRELAADPEGRRRIGAAAAQRMAQSFSMKAAASKIREGMAEAVEARRQAWAPFFSSRGRTRWIRRNGPDLDPRLLAFAATPPPSSHIAEYEATTESGRRRVRWYPASRGRSPALRAFRMAHRLELLGVRTLPHLAAGWVRNAGAANRPVLITGDAPGTQPVRAWVERHADLPEVMSALAVAGGAWLGGLHALCIVPRDLNPANVFVRLGPAILPEFILRDLEKCRIVRRLTAGDVERAFRQLHDAFRPYLTVRQMLRFAAAYRRVRGIGRRTLRRCLLDAVHPARSPVRQRIDADRKP